MSRELPTNINFSIPYEVMIDTKLNLASRVLYAEVLAMSVKYGYCWASNHHFAKVLGISERTATRAVAELSEHGYIAVENPNSQGRKLIPQHRQNGEVPRQNVQPPRQNGAVDRQSGELDTIKGSRKESIKKLRPSGGIKDPGVKAKSPYKPPELVDPEREARKMRKVQEYAERRAEFLKQRLMSEP